MFNYNEINEKGIVVEKQTSVLFLEYHNRTNQNDDKFIKYIHKTGNLYILSFNDNLYFRFNIIDSGKQEDITKGIFSSEILNTQRTSNEIRIEVNDDRLFVFSLL